MHMVARVRVCRVLWILGISVAGSFEGVRGGGDALVSVL